jgi:hypothetical protein
VDMVYQDWTFSLDQSKDRQRGKTAVVSCST